MTCTHQWADATTKEGPEWVCAKCKVTYSKTKSTGYLDSKLNPTKREWVSLTDEEMLEVWNQNGWYVTMFRAIETILKEKNT